MAKTWYPVIDYAACEECGVCMTKCTHSVYDAARTPSPVVINPEACIDHCHECGDLCPVGAIAYVGDYTGWKPPQGAEEAEKTGCDCGCCERSVKSVVVEYLYLDLNTCDRCIGTDNALDEVMLTLTPALQLAGCDVEYRKIEMKTAELAAACRFLSSPTIRVNGRDICQSVHENACGCCSDISGTDVDCRVFEYNGKSYEVPPKEMLAKALLQAVFGQPETGCCCDDYTLPDNLADFYEGKIRKSACCCGDNCADPKNNL